MNLRRLAIVLFLMLALCIPVRAALHVYYSSTGGNPVVYDDVANLAWYRNMSETSLFYNKHYQDQIVIVSGMNQAGNAYHGLSGWRIATDADLNKLLQNRLSDIGALFDLDCFGSTCCAMGRYENNTNPPVPGKHHTFNVTRLTCCEPYDMSAGGYGGFPYTELMQFPGPSNDILFYAAPRPSDGHPPAYQSPDVNSYNLTAWVVTGSVTVSQDGRLIPGTEAIPDPCESNFNDRRTVDTVVNALYETSSFIRGIRPNWTRFQCLFIPQAVITISSDSQASGFVHPRHTAVSQLISTLNAVLRNWSIEAYSLHEVNRTVDSLTDLCHVNSSFTIDASTSSFMFNRFNRRPDTKIKLRGTMSIELSGSNRQWQIVSLGIEIRRNSPVP